MIVGGAAGIVRSSTPVLFAAASGIQCFVLGSTFWFIRGLAIQTRVPGTVTRKEKVYASAIGGGVSGGLSAALFREFFGFLRSSCLKTDETLTGSRQNIVPGVIMFTLFGSLGQTAYNSIDATGDALEVSSDIKTKPNLLERVANSKWSPMKVLSDEDYESMLQEKLLRVEADIAVLDDHLVVLRQQAANGEKQLQEGKQ